MAFLSTEEQALSGVSSVSVLGEGWVPINCYYLLSALVALADMARDAGFLDAVFFCRTSLDHQAAQGLCESLGRQRLL